MNRKKFIKNLSEEGAKDLLSRLLDALDTYAMDDAMGTEGWQHALGFEQEIP